MNERSVHTDYNQGFTLVEVLIVVVVIAILAAVSIVSYNGVQNRANDAAVQVDARSNYEALMLRFAGGESDGSGSNTSWASSSARVTQNSYVTRSLSSFVLGTTSDGKAFAAGISKSGKAFMFKGGTASVTNPWTADNGCSFDTYFNTMNGNFTIWSKSAGWVTMTQCSY